MTTPPEPSDALGSLVDSAVLEELLSLDDGGTGLLSEMVGLFQEDGPMRITQMREACERGDAHGAGEAAHALKGAAGTLGAVRLRALAGEAERLAKANDLAAVLGLVPAMEESYPQFLAALEGFIQSRSEPPP